MDRIAGKKLARAARAEFLDHVGRQGATPGEAAEDIAYTWFIRLAALRHLQAKGWLAVRGASQLEAAAREDVLLHRHIAGAFDRVTGAQKTMFPSGVLAPDTAAHRLFCVLPDAQWTGCDSIGWLHQYYGAQRHEALVGLNKAPVPADKVAQATQLFTPGWIGRFLAENAIGRLSVAGVMTARRDWRFFMPPPAEERADSSLPLQSVRIIDPCVGCGHLLLHAFDLLLALYRAGDVGDRQAAEHILRDNLFGLDIDPRVVQVARFALLSKARSIVPDMRGLSPNIECLCPTDAGTRYATTFTDAGIFGSLLQPPKPDSATAERFPPARWLSDTYDIVLTNPPYLHKMDARLKAFVQRQYGANGADLYTAFIQRGFSLCKPDGFLAYLTPSTWLSLKRHAPIRQQILREKHIEVLLEPAKGAFFAEATVDVCAFVLRNAKRDTPGQYLRLDPAAPDMGAQARAAIRDSESGGRYSVRQEDYLRLEGAPVAYWATPEHIRAFDLPALSRFAAVQEGLKTADNSRYIRKWYELNRRDIGDTPDAKWVFLTKGGPHRKWYGNLEDVLLYTGGGQALRDQPGASMTGAARYFQENISWGRITSGAVSFRYTPPGSIPNMAGLALYPRTQLPYFLGLLNSNAAAQLLVILNPTLNFPPGTLATLPVCITNGQIRAVTQLVRENIALAKADWDEKELSWDFVRHPLIRPGTSRLADAYAALEALAGSRFSRMKANEETLNAIFMDGYGLRHALAPGVDSSKISVRRIVAQTEIRDFLSYAVGCILGRYTTGYGSNPAAAYLRLDAGGERCVASLEAFLAVTFGKETVQENLMFIAASLGGRGGDTRSVIARYFTRHFYADHIKRYKRRPVYWLWSDGAAGGFRAISPMHGYAGAATLAQIHDAARQGGCTDAYLRRLSVAIAAPPVLCLDDGVQANLRRFDGLVSEA